MFNIVVIVNLLFGIKWTIKEIVVYVWFGLSTITDFFFLGVGLGFEKAMVETGSGWIF